MSKISIGAHKRQPLSLFDVTEPSAMPDGVARRGQPPAADGDPRLVTRGYLLQSESLTPCEINPGVVVDWLSFTLPLSSPDQISGVVYELRRLFDGGDVIDRGFRGYTRFIPILGGTGKVAWHPDRADMGVHVDLPSVAIRNMNKDGILGDVADFIGWVLHREGKFTRLDLALDTDKVHMSTIVQAQESGDLVSRAQDRRLIYNYKDGSQTLYVGATSSDRMVRFYDKAKEQKLEGVTWTRAEIQHRHKHAQVAAVAIAAGEVDPVALFNSCIDFRDAASDVNPSRRPRCEWWQSWIGSFTQRVSFAFGKPDKQVRQVVEWVESQVSTSLAMLAVADPDNVINWLRGVVDGGFGRLDPYRRQKAARFRDLGLTLA